MLVYFIYMILDTIPPQKSFTKPLSSIYKWASSWENVSSGVSDQVRLKPACSAIEAS